MKILIIPGFTGHPNEITFKDLTITLENHGYDVIKVAWPHFPTELEKYSMTETIEYVKSLMQSYEASEVTILGFSMGGIVAAHVAAEYKPKKFGLIVCPFQAGTSDDLEGKYKEWKDTGYRELKSSAYGQLKIPFSFIEDARKYNVLDVVGSISCPKLFIAGEKDDKVPFTSTKKIYDLASEPKEWHLIPGMQHKYQYQEPKYMQEVNDIIISFVCK